MENKAGYDASIGNLKENDKVTISSSLNHLIGINDEAQNLVEKMELFAVNLTADNPEPAIVAGEGEKKGPKSAIVIELDRQVNSYNHFLARLNKAFSEIQHSIY